MALAAAPFGSGLELFALVAFIVRPGRWCPVTGYMIAAVLVSRAGNALRRLAPGRMARIEREWRDVHGMPRRHPESLTRALRRREERRLAALRAELWPDSEYEAEL